jgi:hypothetical protein
VHGLPRHLNLLVVFGGVGLLLGAAAGLVVRRRRYIAMLAVTTNAMGVVFGLVAGRAIVRVATRPGRS